MDQGSVQAMEKQPGGAREGRSAVSKLMEVGQDHATRGHGTLAPEPLRLSSS